MKKIILIIFIISLSIAQNVYAERLAYNEKCPDYLILTQNLKAPEIGEKYIRNGSFHWYTKSIVKEAKTLQKQLNRLGFAAGEEDGIIGPNTKSAIIRMQEFLGTKKDGYVGSNTRMLLNNSCPEKKEKVTALYKGYYGYLDKLDQKTKSKFIFKGNSNKKQVSLTFDDGPIKNSREIINYFNSIETPATFFLICNKINKENSKKYKSKFINAGYHTYSHRNFDKLSAIEIKNEFTKCNDIFKENNLDTKYFRPAYGITESN